MTDPTGEPFAPGSISLGLYLENLPPVEAIDEMLLQAQNAIDSGFDGVTVSEHHAGFEGYMPSPVLGASWILDHLATGWSAACPILLPLRSVNLLLEDIAWLASRHPGRVAAGFAPGFEEADFAVAGAQHETRRADYYRDLPVTVDGLRGVVEGPLKHDPAIRRCATHPVPVLAAVAGPVATRKAATAGAGLLIATFKDAAQARELCKIYREAGGSGPRVLVRRCWVGPRPEGSNVRPAEKSTKPAAPRAWANGDRTDMLRADTGDAVAGLLHDRLTESDATALSIRLQLPGGDPSATRDQIRKFGTEVIPNLRSLLAPAEPVSSRGA